MDAALLQMALPLALSLSFLGAVQPADCKLAKQQFSLIKMLAVVSRTRAFSQSVSIVLDANRSVFGRQISSEIKKHLTVNARVFN